MGQAVRLEKLENLLEKRAIWFADHPGAASTVSLPFYHFRLGTTHELMYREDLFPPCAFLASIAGFALEARHLQSSRYVIWIGKEIWPSPYILKKVSSLEESLFLDPPQQLFPWTVVSALNCKAAVAVIAHYDRIPFQLSKKLTLSARKGGALGLFVRKASKETRSAAASSWLVEPEVSEEPLWKATLLRSKGGFHGEKVSFYFSPEKFFG